MNYALRITMIITQLFLFTSPLFSQDKEAKTLFSDDTAINLSIVYPLSLNKSDEIHTNINLSMFYGRVGSVSGLEISGLVNNVKRDVSGLEHAGIANIVGNNFYGWQSAGIANILGGDGELLQTAGLVNVVGGKFSGLQTSGICNFVKSGVHGLQAAGIANIVTGNSQGLQVAGIANVLKGDFRGVQSAVVNLAYDLNGAQFGVVNKAGKVEGIQVGVINIADEIDGVPIGLVNITKKGSIHGLAWSSNIILSNVGVKFRVNDYFYSILCAGYNNNKEEITKSLALGYFMGFHIPLVDQMYLETDIGGYNVDNEKIFSRNDDNDQHMLQSRLMIGYEFSNTIACFAGCGINYTVNRYQKFFKGIGDPMFMVGVQFL